jgi:hypothetical protein
VGVLKKKTTADGMEAVEDLEVAPVDAEPDIPPTGFTDWSTLGAQQI